MRLIHIEIKKKGRSTLSSRNHRTAGFISILPAKANRFHRLSPPPFRTMGDRLLESRKKTALVPAGRREIRE